MSTSTPSNHGLSRESYGLMGGNDSNSDNNNRNSDNNNNNNSDKCDTTRAQPADLSSLGKFLRAKHDRVEEAYNAAKEIQYSLSEVQSLMDYKKNNLNNNNDDRMNLERSEAKLDELIFKVMKEFEDKKWDTMDTTTDNRPDNRTNNRTDSITNDRTNNNNKLLDGNDDTPRLATLGRIMEQYLQFKAYRHFVCTGKILVLNSNSKCNDQGLPLRSGLRVRDEEYLGALMSLAHDLAQYAVGRAISDVNVSVSISSIHHTRDLVERLVDEFLKFDFRNGHLRRKYDSLKYAHKKIETILYQLSIVQQQQEQQRQKQQQHHPSTDDTTVEQPLSKRTELNLNANTNDTVDVDVDELSIQLEEMRKRHERRDEIRESVIKRCRDGQKSAKKAIFALHRENPGSAQQELQLCEKVMWELLPTFQNNPIFRWGSFSAVVEEYVEAKLFAVWLGLDLNSADNNDNNNKHPHHPRHKVLSIHEFDFHLTTEEYLGGLADFTGEIGRYAVKMGTLRNFPSVQQCLETTLSIFWALKQMPLPSNVLKKMDSMRISVEKLKQLLYELTLVHASGNLVTITTTTSTFHDWEDPMVEHETLS